MKTALPYLPLKFFAPGGADYLGTVVEGKLIYFLAGVVIHAAQGQRCFLYADRAGKGSVFPASTASTLACASAISSSVFPTMMSGTLS